MGKKPLPPLRKRANPSVPAPKNAAVLLDGYIQDRITKRNRLSEIEKLYLAKQIAEITKKYHEEEKANFYYDVKIFLNIQAQTK